MIPGSITALLLFVAGLGPGYVFLRTAETRRPHPDRSDLLETIEILGIGLLVTAFGALVALLAGAVFPHVLVEGNDWLSGGNDYLRSEVLRPIRSAALTLAIAVVLAWGFPRLLYRKAGKRLAVGISAWQRYLDGEEEVAKWAQALMRDGRIVEGVVDSFTFDVSTPTDDRELALVPPFFVTAPGSERTPYSAGRVLIIPGREIVQLAVSDVRARHADSQRRQ